MKIDQADKYFSLYVRNRDKWTCVRCKGAFRYGGLQASHFFGRRMESVRFDLENVDALCYGCHRYWEKEDREAYREFKVKQLGERGFQALNLRARLIAKKDRKMMAIVWKNACWEAGYI